MACQICIAGNVAALAEAVRFAQASHLDMDKVYEAISGGAAQSWQMDNRWQSMNEDRFDFGFAIDWMRKDLGLSMEEGRGAGRVDAGGRADRPVLMPTSRRWAAAGWTPAPSSSVCRGKAPSDIPIPCSAQAAVKLQPCRRRPPACWPSPALADTLVDNVIGITPDGKGGVSHFDAFLIGDDGRIAQVFVHGDKRPKKVEYQIDGKGRVVVPGMIDAHGHVMATGFAQMTLDLSGARSLDEALARIAAWAAVASGPAVDSGFSGWNQFAWGLGRMPTAAELDRGDRRPPSVADARRRPCRLGQHRRAQGCRHYGRHRRSRQADSIERKSGSKQPAGVLVGSAAALVDAKAPQPRPEDLRHRCGRGAAGCFWPTA